MRFIKKRFLISFICLIVSVLLTIQLMKMTEKTKETVHVIRVNSKIERGTQIKEDILKTVEVGSYGVQQDIISSKEQVIGKFAAADLYPEDNLTNEKFTEIDILSDSFVIKTQMDRKTAVSVALKGISSSLSGKLKKGDVVSVYVYVQDNTHGFDQGYVKSYPELQYLEIAAITNSKAVDVIYNAEYEDDKSSKSTSGDAAIPASVTFIADERQAIKLIEAENIGNIHLVFRGRGAYGMRLLEDGVNAQPSEENRGSMKPLDETWQQTASVLQPGLQSGSQSTQQPGLQSELQPGLQSAQQPELQSSLQSAQQSNQLLGEENQAIAEPNRGVPNSTVQKSAPDVIVPNSSVPNSATPNNTIQNNATQNSTSEGAVLNSAPEIQQSGSLEHNAQTNHDERKKITNENFDLG